MEPQRINRISGRVAIGLSSIALVTVISGYFQEPLPDEGTSAHIFQLAVAALVPVIVAFLATADWNQPRRVARPMALTAAILAMAFTALFYLENVWYKQPRH